MPEMDRSAVMDLYATLRAQWETRNGEYDLARRRYHGEHWDAGTNPAPINRYWLTLNYLKPFVDKSVQLLVGRMPAIQVMPPGVDEPSRRLAEQLEGILYGTWQRNDAVDVFQKTAWDSFVLRRGVIYVWWDPDEQRVRFKNCAPEHFFPEYDGDRIHRAVYVQRRSTDALKEMYPDEADDILDDAAMNYPIAAGASMERVNARGQTTVIDLYTSGGKFYRVMGNAMIERDLQLPFKKIPFIEYPCFPISGETEPLNLIDQLVELNQYVDQLFSQHADIISRYANPVVLDHASGQSPENIRRAMGAPGAVIPLKRDGDITLLGWSGNIPAIEEQMTFALDALFDLAGKPRSSFGQTVTNQSGVVTNLALTPTLQSNEQHETIWGQRLGELNEWILALWQKNMSGSPIRMQGRHAGQTGSMKYYDVDITGEEIGGWYQNRIKWPSAIRTDDPVYVQNNLQQLTSDPPGVSLYTYLERAGVEDVEAEIDRIQQQLEDPRLHPDRLTAAVGAASTIEQAGLPTSGDMGGFAPDGGLGPGLTPDGAAAGGFSDSLEAGASPNKDALVKTAKPGY
jgi:hypothetical protein